MTTGGMYFPFGEMRLEALRFALESVDGETPAEDIVSRAGLYFRFLVGEQAEGNS